jgi:hypothetical protein
MTICLTQPRPNSGSGIAEQFGPVRPLLYVEGGSISARPKAHSALVLRGWLAGITFPGLDKVRL